MTDPNLHPKINSIYDFTEKGKAELIAELQKWFRPRKFKIGPIDSTDNVGLPWGVQSIDPSTGNEDEGLVLTSTGDGGSIWSPLKSGFASYRECVLSRDTLEFYWPMDEASGNLVDLVQGIELAPVTDIGFPTYDNPGPFSSGAVGFGGTYGFTGSQDRFTVGGLGGSPTLKDVLSGTSAWTMEGWVYTTSVNAATDNRIIDFSDAGGDGILVSAGFSGDPYVSITRGSDGAGDSVSTVYGLNTWTHWRITYDGSTLEVYINGVLSDTGASTASMSTLGTNFAVGNNDGPPTFFWAPQVGRVSDLAIYSSRITGFCPTVTSSGPATAAEADQVLTGDGSGNTSWAYPTIEVEF